MKGWMETSSITPTVSPDVGVKDALLASSPSQSDYTTFFPIQVQTKKDHKAICNKAQCRIVDANKLYDIPIIRVARY